MDTTLILLIVVPLTYASIYDTESSKFGGCCATECNFDEDCQLLPCIKRPFYNEADCTQFLLFINRCLCHKYVQLEQATSDKCILSGCEEEKCVDKNDTKVYPCALNPRNQCYLDYGACGYSRNRCEWNPSSSLPRCVFKK